MAPSLIVRNLDEDVKAKLVQRAAKNGHSMEAEARSILTEAVSAQSVALAFYQLGQEAGGVDELKIPTRDDEARWAAFE